MPSSNENTGNNATPTYVRVAKSFAYDSRRRAGLNFGKKPVAIELTADQLEAIEADSQLEIITKARYDEEVAKFASVEASTSVAEIKKQGAIRKSTKANKSENGINVKQGVRGSSAIARAANAKAGK